MKPFVGGHSQYIVDDLTLNEPWRLFQIMAEFVRGFEEMPETYPAVTIFGSAQIATRKRRV